MSAGSRKRQDRRRRARRIGSVGVQRLDVFLLSVALNILSLVLPLVVLQVYDRIIPERSMDTFTFLMLAIGGAIILDFVLRELRNRIMSWSAARFEHRAGTAAADSILSGEITALEQVPASVQLDRFAAVDAIREQQSGQSLITYADIPFVAVFLGLIWLIAGPLVFAPIALGIAALLAAIVLAGLLSGALRRRSDLDDDRYNFIFTVLNGIHTVKGLGLEAQLQRQYEAMLTPLAQSVERVAFLSFLGQAISPTFSNLAMVATAAFGSLLVVSGDITSGTLIACILLSGRALQPLSRLIALWVQSRTMKVAKEKLDALLTLPDEADRFESAAQPSPDRRVPVVGREGAPAIEMSGVTVHYGRVDHPVLNQVDLRIPLGAFVTVSGAVGGGKTALLDVLAGLIAPDDGEMRYRGEKIGDLGVEAYRSIVGFARQIPQLYRGTLEDNLTSFGNREDLGRALMFARALGLDETIATMPKGLNTPLGDSATDQIPSSVQQQISLVRILAQGPQLLLLDEANSGFDLETDRRFRTLLTELKGRITIVMLTSRPSLISLSDLRLDIDQGHVTVIGGDEAAAEAER